MNFSETLMDKLRTVENIVYTPDAGEISSRLKLDQLGGAFSLDSLLEQAVAVARPKAAWALFEPKVAQGNTVDFDGEMLSSHVLRVNLEECHSAALFVATCGMELESWCDSFGDPLERWVADEICEDVLRCANSALESELDKAIEGKYRVSMNPGSLEDWPLAEQGPLFRALAGRGDIRGATGVELTESFLMKPRKSLSGVRFASSQPFTNCMLCPRDNCRGRRMRYDPAMFEMQYAGAKSGALYAGSCGCGHDSAR